MMNRRRFLTSAAGLAALAALPACGGPDTSPTTGGPAAAGEGYPRTVRHEHGETRLERAPQRVVCGTDGVCSAVLLRAAAPMTGLDVMHARRPAARSDTDLCSGPARLTQALGIVGDLDGVDLVRGAVRIVDDGVPPPKRPGVSTRIGLRSGRGDEHPWRFYVPGDPNVSRGPHRQLERPAR